MILKKFLNKVMYLTAALFISLSILSCQNEETEITNPEPSEVLENDSTLTNLISKAVSEEDTQDHIKCLDFEYPISISVFDTSFDVADTENITSDAQFYALIETLSDVIASINYPITTLFSGEELIEINDNEGLTSILLDAQGTECDPMVIVPECTEAFINENLLACNWLITTFSSDEQLLNLTLIFNQDGTLDILENNIITSSGDWLVFEEIYDVNRGPELGLLINSDILRFSGVITECDDDFINIIDVDTNIILEKNCTTEEDSEITAAKELIINDGCTWLMDRYIVDDQTPFTTTIDKSFVFSEDGKFIFSDATTYTGNWTFEKDNDDNLLLILNPEQSLPEYIDYDYKMDTFREGFMIWSAINANQDIITGFEQSCI